MITRAKLNPILNNEHITRGLDDPEARLLIDWLVERADVLGDPTEVERLCRRVRAIARFVALWCHEPSHVAALQLAATERFRWPLPVYEMDACDLMQEILAWESDSTAL